MGASLYVVLFINLNYDNSTHKDRKIIDTSAALFKNIFYVLNDF